MSRQRLRVGIDPGANTGFSAWNLDTGKLQFVKSAKIHQAMRAIEALASDYEIKVRVEDARLRKWFGNRSNSKQQGAGSIKRDSKIWEDYLSDLKRDGLIASYEMIHPLKGATKLNQAQFKNLTGYDKMTNEHGRDAAMMVFQYNNWL